MNSWQPGSHEIGVVGADAAGGVLMVSGGVFVPGSSGAYLAGTAEDWGAGTGVCARASPAPASRPVREPRIPFLMGSPTSKRAARDGASVTEKSFLRVTAGGTVGSEKP